MKIDCATCRVRPVGCDGCMMQVLFSPVTSADAAVAGELAVVSSRPAPAVELAAAIDVLASAGLVTAAEARRARAGIAADRGAEIGNPGDLRSAM